MDGPFIQFESTAQELRQASCLPYSQRQHPRGQRIQSSQVPDPASFQVAPRRLNHVMRSQATGFINYKESVDFSSGRMSHFQRGFVMSQKKRWDLKNEKASQTRV